MKLFDLHCDTILKLWLTEQSIKTNDHHFALDKTSAFEKHVQVTAIYTKKKYSDAEGWDVFRKASEFYEKQTCENGISQIKTSDDLVRFHHDKDKKTAFILSVEDARILENDVSRLKYLYDAGVRIITLLWGGDTVIGGSHNTDHGLTPFGRKVVEKMIGLGIIPDISHASPRSTDEILDICEQSGVSPIATHMNAHSVCAHTRNLTTERYERLVSLGGIAGISLCPKHLTINPESASAKSAAEHILYYRALQKENVALGCDLDGTPLPSDICDISDLPKIASVLSQNHLTDDDIEDVFYNNAYQFMLKNLPKK